MKYVRTHETRDKFLADKDSTSRGFRLAPTLYKYSDESEDEDNRDHIYLELDDPRKHEGSTYMEIALTSDVEFSFYIDNKSGDTQTTMTCTIDWGDDTIETKTITKDTYGFKLAHNYVAGSYKIELYDVERDYSVGGFSKRTDQYGGYISNILPIDSVKRVILHKGVSIALSAFCYCTSLTSIFIPEKVVIGEYAFKDCSSLTSIHIPEGITTIDQYAFYNCSSLKSIHIPESVNSIRNRVFAWCTSLKSINIPESVNSIGEYVFAQCRSLTSVYISGGVTSIKYAAFNYCTSLKSIDIPEKVTSIENSAFGNCFSLISVNIPEGVTIINPYVFHTCKSLKSIYLPSGITTIKQYAFRNCSSLKSIDIPEKVTSIGDSAFEGCSSLTSISSFNLTTPTLGGNIFLNLPTNGTLHIKPGATGYDAWLSKLPEGWRIVEDL